MLTLSARHSTINFWKVIVYWQIVTWLRKHHGYRGHWETQEEDSIYWMFECSRNPSSYILCERYVKCTSCEDGFEPTLSLKNVIRKVRLENDHHFIRFADDRCSWKDIATKSTTTPHRVNQICVMLTYT